MKKTILAIFICTATSIFASNDKIGIKQMETVIGHSDLVEDVNINAGHAIVVMGRLDMDHNELYQSGKVTVDCFTANQVCMIIEIPDNGNIQIRTNGIDNPIDVDDYSISDFPGGQSVSITLSNN